MDHGDTAALETAENGICFTGDQIPEDGRDVARILYFCTVLL